MLSKIRETLQLACLNSFLSLCVTPEKELSFSSFAAASSQEKNNALLFRKWRLELFWHTSKLIWDWNRLKFATQLHFSRLHPWYGVLHGCYQRSCSNYRLATFLPGIRMNRSLYLKHIRTHYIGLNFLFLLTRNIDLSKKKNLLEILVRCFTVGCVWNWVMLSAPFSINSSHFVLQKIT